MSSRGSALDRSLVQRSPNGCGVSESDLKSSIMRRRSQLVGLLHNGKKVQKSQENNKQSLWTKFKIFVLIKPMIHGCILLCTGIILQLYLHKPWAEKLFNILSLKHKKFQHICANYLLHLYLLYFCNYNMNRNFVVHLFLQYFVLLPDVNCISLREK
jgi:hypothetical protein